MSGRKRNHRDDALIALLVGDAPADAALRAWLATPAGREAYGAYRRLLAGLDTLLGPAGAGTRHRAGAPARRRARPARVYYTTVRTPLGRVSLASTERGLARVSFRRKDAAFVAELRRRLGAEVVKAPERLRPVAAALARYFAGARHALDVPVDLAVATPFQRRVLLATRRVPAGRVVSYGDIARRIGQPRASRAVGQALGHNPIPIVIPCHRVVAGGGGLGGYTGGLWIKKKLLAIEGAYPRAVGA